MRSPFRTLPVFLALLACQAPPETAQPAFPSAQRIAAGRPMAMHRNDPMGYHGTMALMTQAPSCGTLRAPGSERPLQISLAGRAVTPAFNLVPAACPSDANYLSLDRAVALEDGLYAAGASHECFLPNSGGGHCRAVGQ